LRARCTRRTVSSVFYRRAYYSCIASCPKGASGLLVSPRLEGSFGDLPRSPKAIGIARELASRAQSNGFARDLTRSPKAIVQWLIRNSTSGAFGSLCQAPCSEAERRGRIERSMHQTRRFKRINGTAYPDSIASILRDASGGEHRSETSPNLRIHRVRETLPVCLSARDHWL
jgi:hypothetical protein